MAFVHEPAPHARIAQLGKISLAEAFSSLEQRSGRKLRYAPAPGGVDPQAAIESLEAHHALVETKGYDSFRNRTQRADARRKVMRAITDAKFPLQPERLVAALALRFGLDREALYPHVAEWENIGRAYSKKGPGKTVGPMRDVSWLLKAVRGNLLVLVNDLLHESPQAMTAGRIARQLIQIHGLTQKPENLHKDVIAALAVLDTLGLTYKISGREQHYVWTHACFQKHPVTKPDWNLGYNILNALVEGPKQIGNLSLTVSHPLFDFGTNEGLASPSAITRAYDRLQTAGFIHVETVKSVGKQAELTDNGRRSMSEQKSLPYLHPEIREGLLLPPKSKGELPIPVSNAVEKLLRWEKVHRALAGHREEKSIPPGKTPQAGVVRVALATLEGEGYVAGVARGNTPKVSGKYLDKALEHLDASLPESAAYLREKLARPKPERT